MQKRTTPSSDCSLRLIILSYCSYMSPSLNKAFADSLELYLQFEMAIAGVCQRALIKLTEKLCGFR